MKKLLAALLLGIGIFACSHTYASTGACIGTGGSCETTTTVQATISGGNICIGFVGELEENGLNFGTFIASSVVQVVSGTYSDKSYFYVDDQKGADQGYYTTLQLSGSLNGTGGQSISGTNLYVKAPPTYYLAAGTDNPRVVIDLAMASFQSLNLPRQLILRDSEANFGIVGKYGSMPDLQLIIPAYQGVGRYQGTMVFTLYEN